MIIDRNANPDAFSQYIAWHHKHAVALLHLDRETAFDLARRHNLGTIIDWSYWQGELALSYDYETNAVVRMRLTFVDESTYRRAHEFLRELLEEAQAFDRLTT